MMRFALKTSIGAIALMAAMPASAQIVANGTGATVTGANTGGTVILNFDGNSDGIDYTGLSGQLSLSFAGIVGGDYTFTYTLWNTSSLDSRISGIAFDTNPNITGGTAGGVFTNLRTNNTYPNGVGNVEVCLQSGGNGNTCAGGGGSGVADGASANGTFVLDFGNVTPATIDLTAFHVRYQSLDFGSGSGTGNVVPGIPEPSTWAMMLLGFGAVGFSMRRRRKASQGLLQIA